MRTDRRTRRRVAHAFVCLCLILFTHSALGALDPVRGPREHRTAEEITFLQYQLLDAVLMGDTKLLNITNLITAGADPNGYDTNHMTPLHWAVIKGQRLAVALLLERGAHTDVRDSSDRTPMHFVGIYGWYRCLYSCSSAHVRFFRGRIRESLCFSLAY
jgi:hypothetical protein